MLIFLIAVFSFSLLQLSQLNKQLDIIKTNQIRNSTDLFRVPETPMNYERFKVYYSPRMEKSTFLVDNKEGIVYQLVEDSKTKDLWWKKSFIKDKFNSLPTK